MSDHIHKTIEDALAELKRHEDAALETKKLVNQLCTFAKIPIKFPDLSETQATRIGATSRNAFYGQPLSKCVREYLEWRKENCPTKEATLDEIMAALKEGNYDLASVSKDYDGQKRGVAISLGKNTSTFHKLPNGDFGLVAWYSNIRAKRQKNANGATANNAESADTGTEETPESDPTSPEVPADLEFIDDFAPKEGAQAEKKTS